MSTQLRIWFIDNIENDFLRLFFKYDCIEDINYEEYELFRDRLNRTPEVTNPEKTLQELIQEHERRFSDSSNYDPLIRPKTAKLEIRKQSSIDTQFRVAKRTRYLRLGDMPHEKDLEISDIFEQNGSTTE